MTEQHVRAMLLRQLVLLVYTAAREDADDRRRALSVPCGERVA